MNIEKEECLKRLKDKYLEFITNSDVREKLTKADSNFPEALEVLLSVLHGDPADPEITFEVIPMAEDYLKQYMQQYKELVEHQQRPIVIDENPIVLSDDDSDPLQSQEEITEGVKWQMPKRISQPAHLSDPRIRPTYPQRAVATLPEPPMPSHSTIINRTFMPNQAPPILSNPMHAFVPNQASPHMPVNASSIPDYLRLPPRIPPTVPGLPYSLPSPRDATLLLPTFRSWIEKNNQPTHMNLPAAMPTYRLSSRDPRCASTYGEHKRKKEEEKRRQQEEEERNRKLQQMEEERHRLNEEKRKANEAARLNQVKKYYALENSNESSPTMPKVPPKPSLKVIKGNGSLVVNGKPVSSTLEEQRLIDSNSVSEIPPQRKGVLKVVKPNVQKQPESTTSTKRKAGDNEGSATKKLKVVRGSENTEYNVGASTSKSIPMTVSDIVIKQEIESDSENPESGKTCWSSHSDFVTSEVKVKEEPAENLDDNASNSTVRLETPEIDIKEEEPMYIDDVATECSDVDDKLMGAIKDFMKSCAEPQTVDLLLKNNVEIGILQQEAIEHQKQEIVSSNKKCESWLAGVMNTPPNSDDEEEIQSYYPSECMPKPEPMSSQEKL